MSNEKKNTNNQNNVMICEDKALPPVSSSSRMPKVKPVAQAPTKAPTKQKN